VTKVDPVVLKSLRKAKGWSQEQLAEKTKAGKQPKIDKQTISRLERGERPRTRTRTIKQLAQALGTDPAVLTGDSPAPEFAPATSSLDPRSQLNVRVASASRNALTLVAWRYQVQPFQIVELAPFLFVWAAEESLRQRRDCIAEVERAYDAALKVEKDIRHLPIPNSTYSDEKIVAEHESIKCRDLFGNSIQEQDFLDPAFKFDSDTENPFAIFLSKLVAPFGDVANFESWSGSWSPQYRVCPEEAAKLVGGDRDRADEILLGVVALNEMPKEIRNPGMEKERAEWVRVKAEEHRQKLAEEFPEFHSLMEEQEVPK
jgi:transcriptional regulator with XRE-family HTH domain